MAPYVKDVGPSAPYSNLRGRLFLSKHCITGLWFGVVHPQYQCATCMLASFDIRGAQGRASAGIDVLESSSSSPPPPPP